MRAVPLGQHLQEPAKVFSAPLVSTSFRANVRARAPAPRSRAPRIPMQQLPTSLTKSANQLSATHLGRRIEYDIDALNESLDESNYLRLLPAVTTAISTASVPHLYNPRPSRG